MPKDKNKKEKSPVIVKVHQYRAKVQNEKKSSNAKLIVTRDPAINLVDSVIHEDSLVYRISPESSHKKETTITTNFATPPRPKK